MRRKSMTIFDFTESLRRELEESGRYRQSEIHTSAIHSVYEFCGGRYPLLKELFTRGFLRRYEAFLKTEDCSRNTVSFYTSTLRALYYEAVRRHKVKQVNRLFSGVFTGADPTQKRAATPGVVGVLAAADLTDVPRLERCRDYFVLSFFLHGMPFVDLAHLQKTDIQGDAITYRRHKTGSFVRVPMLTEAKEIIAKYAGEVTDSMYVLPILDPKAENLRCCYKSALRKQNRQLNALAARLGIQEHLTTYVARHSWATIAHHNDVSTAVVSQAMGHRSEEVTRTYLASFDDDKLMEAGRTVLSAVVRAVQEQGIPCGGVLKGTVHEAADATVKSVEEGVGGKKKCPSPKG